MRKKTLIKFICFFAMVVTPVIAHSSVRWDDQAQRLQFINATLLESWQMGEYPLPYKLYFNLKSVISILPKVNGQVGGKSEKSTAPAFHAIPTLQLNYQVFQPLVWQLWGGYLPHGLEAVANINGEFSQSLIGTAIIYKIDDNWFTPIGVQWSHAQYEGNISSTNPNDKDSFSSMAWLYYTGVGYSFNEKHLWTTFIVGKKSNKSEYKIKEDLSDVRLEDTLSDSESNLGVTLQASVGYNHDLWQFGIGEIYVPERVLMTKLLVSYALPY